MGKILLMEDDPDQARFLAEILAEAGHDVIVRDTASSAIVAFVEGGIGLVVVDILVKQDDRYSADGGLRLIGHVRLAEAKSPPAPGRRMPVIAISGGYVGKAGMNLLSVARDIGADVAMAKPVVPEELVARVNELVLT